MSRAGFTEDSATRHRRGDIRSRERETGKRDTMSRVGATGYRLSAGDRRYPRGTQRPAEVQKLLGDLQTAYQKKTWKLYCIVLYCIVLYCIVLYYNWPSLCLSPKLKIGVLQSFVRDLSEQNQVLIQTLEELETGSEQRVNSLESELEEYACRLKENDQENRTLRSTQESLEQDIYVSSDLENGLPSLALCPMPSEHLSGTMATIHGTQ
ncbi:hypothetical protein AOXY_G18264 [Acipenser oxyrinchus oxyrinchus]|uniref:Uncharacterized protein n=1 Tax=Acipenser oxyrinchus oxyrinchus TaxID=40147 RepID=A0AAD8D3S7_ACIOX|nr:hypothetical protein AOXY_G18264 [Acipenser oxyrinchus oxyrinchus]